MSESLGGGYGKGSASFAWVWAALAAILVLYVISVLRVDPIATFGSPADDALYFSSAKALATGQGYVLPGFPVRLRATKYPELYPLLLAGIWKIDPRFPGNVMLAVDLMLAFGCGALCFAFLLLRRWPGMGDWEALAATGLCAFTGYFLFLSASTMSDIPFMAMVLGAIWMGECRDWGSASALGAGIFAGFSVGFRSLGVAAIAGIGLMLLMKRDFRRVLWFSLATVPLTLIFLWPALTAMFHRAGPRLAVGLIDSGWTQTLCYYSSYACSWRMSATTPKALEAVILANLKSVIQEPGLYLLTPVATQGGLWSLVLVNLVGIAAYAGIVRYLRKAGWHPLVVTFAFYLLVILPWPYTPQRFLVAFLPLFFGGLWLEGRHFVSVVAKHLRPAHWTMQATIAIALAAAGLVLVATIAVNFIYSIPAQVSAQAASNSRFLADQRGAYAWIRQHAAPKATVIAYEDGLLFLYTGRPSVIPIACFTQSFYEGDPQFAQHDAKHLADVARHVGASYWLATVRDFELNGDLDYALLQKRERQLLSATPVVYQSADGDVSLHDLRSLRAINGDAPVSADDGNPTVGSGSPPTNQ